MPVIGVFVPTKNGGWEGNVRTLTISAKIRFVPNDNRNGEGAPAFRLYAGKSEVGAAWRRRSDGKVPYGFLKVRLDDPSLSEPISATLFGRPDGGEGKLIWARSSPID